MKTGGVEMRLIRHTMSTLCNRIIFEPAFMFMKLCSKKQDLCERDLIKEIPPNIVQNSYAASPEMRRLHCASHDHHHFMGNLHVRFKTKVTTRRRFKHEPKI